MANCLYNGVELPALPEWDMETHPYAIIGYCDAQGYVFSYAAKPWTANEDGQIFPSRFLTYRLSDDTWVSTNGVVSHVAPVWTNTDIYTEDGSVYLAASDPIPVNQAPTLDPTSLLMCWQVGNRIRQRGNIPQIIITFDEQGNVSITGSIIIDDGEGNVTITSSGSVSITDDGYGNVVIAQRR